ncbi:MAG: amidohydrolase, partial [Eubacterium sp.]|nr:amidohydrolase [Eubacterium sp.]
MIKFTNGYILDKDFNIKKEDVYVEGSKIVSVGKELNADRVYDLKGNLLMPSFKNAHTHSAMTFARSLADD